MRCGLVEAWVYGHMVIKFADTPEPVKKPMICYRHCPEEATIVMRNPDGLTFHWCTHHAKTPICGALPVE